jgi:hypothetical protein
MTFEFLITNTFISRKANVCIKSEPYFKDVGAQKQLKHAGVVANTASKTSKYLEQRSYALRLQGYIISVTRGYFGKIDYQFHVHLQVS